MKRTFLTLALLSLWSVALVTPSADAWGGGGGSGTAPCCRLFGHHNYTTQITCRPYNAFTPICWGNLVCDGCCPQPCAVASGCLPLNMGAPPWCHNYGMAGMPCMSPGFGGGCGPDGCCASDMPMGPPMHAMQPHHAMPMPAYQMPQYQATPAPVYQMPPHHTMPMPDVRTAPTPVPFTGPTPNAPFTAPMPSPAGPGAVGHWPSGSAQAPPWSGVTQANYNPNYYPAAYPGYYPPMQTPMGYYPQPAWPQQQMPYYWYGYGR